MQRMVTALPVADGLADASLDAYCDEADKRILRSLPADIAAALTWEQRLRLVWAVKPIPTKHGLALRASFKLFGKRYYLAAFGGEDCRNIERLRSEGQTDAIPVGITFLIVFGLVAIYGLVPLAFLLYFVKSALGIDLFDGPSPFHPWFCG
ncbi:MAG: hypothetical protein R3D68_05590 [Hyphomicrobiaceae bacterium]